MSALEAHVKADVMSKFQRSEGDVGSPEVQVALLTARIKLLTEHLKENKKDFHSRRGLMNLVSRRRGLLKYLKRIDLTRYADVIKALGLRH